METNDNVTYDGMPHYQRDELKNYQFILRELHFGDEGEFSPKCDLCDLWKHSDPQAVCPSTCEECTAWASRDVYFCYAWDKDYEANPDLPWACEGFLSGLGQPHPDDDLEGPGEEDGPWAEGWELAGLAVESLIAESEVQETLPQESTRMEDDPEMLTSVPGGAFRKNGGKPMLSLVPQGLMEGCARVLEFGMRKYSRNNWRRGFKDSEIMDSLLRHVTAYTNGEETDPESGLCHLDHAAANIAFALEQRRVRLAGGMMGKEDLISCPQD